MSEAADRSPNTADTPKTADELRADIEATRAELAETADALAAKLDVKAQAKEKVQAAGDRISTTVTENKTPIGAVAGSAAAVVALVVVLRVRRNRTPKAKLAKALAKSETRRQRRKK